MIDLSRLTPAPWKVVRDSSGSPFIVYPGSGSIGDCYLRLENHLEFIALARNAYDIMLRRKWNPTEDHGRGWLVETNDGVIVRKHDGVAFRSDCPFTALDEADRWYKEHVES